MLDTVQKKAEIKKLEVEVTGIEFSIGATKQKIEVAEKAYNFVVGKIKALDAELENILSDIKSKSNKITIDSNFKDRYYDKVSEVLHDNNTNNTKESLQRMKRKILNKICEYEDDIEDDKLKIKRKKEKIQRLKRELLEEEE